MTQQTLTIIQNKKIASGVYEMKLSGDVSAVAAPGQFINILLPKRFLRRPISVCDVENGMLTIIYKVVGEGTNDLSRFNEGDELDCLLGLGNGYDLSVSGERPLLLGGGVGVPPLYLLAKKLGEQGKNPVAVLGFNSKKDVFYIEQFKQYCDNVILVTADGSMGEKGFVTDHLPEKYSYFYSCGPEPMLKAVCGVTKTGGQLSLEERMGCGFGACMGCSHKTTNGYKRVCREGPVFLKEELLWDD